MCTLYESILSLCVERGIKGGKMCVDLGLSKSLMTDLKSGRKKGITAETAQKIADYFSVSVDRVLGVEKAPIQRDERGDTLDSTESSRKLKLLARHLNRIPEETRNRLLSNFEDTIDTYLDAMGIPREDEDS